VATSCVSTPADDRLVGPIYPFRDQMDTLLMIFSGFILAQLTCANGMWLTTSRQRPMDVAKLETRLDRTPQASLR
jgi:hypothetical protein